MRRRLAAVVKRVRDRLVERVTAEPVRAASLLGSVLVALGLVDVADVGTIVGILIVILGGEAVRASVFSPATVDRIVALAGRG